MVSCTVFGCLSNRQRKEAGVTFHAFPRDLTLRHVWAAAIGKQDWKPNKYSRICSKHFEARYLRKTSNKIYLIKSTVPTLFLHMPSQVPKTVQSSVKEATNEETILLYASDDDSVPTDMLLGKMNSETSIDKSESMEKEIVPPNTMHCQPNKTIDLTKEDILKTKRVSSTESASGVFAPYLCYAADLTITRQLENICRLCLKEKGTWDLTKSYISDTGEEVFKDMLWDCFGLKIPRLTYCGVSKMMCSDCAVSLTQAYKFKQQVVLASATFNSYCDRNLEDSPESEFPIFKSRANSETSLLRQLLQKAPLNINCTEIKNENDNMSTPTSTNVRKNVDNDHNYSKSGQEDKSTSTENKIKKNDQKTSKEIQKQPVKKSTRKRPRNATKKSGNTGRIVKKSVHRIIIDIDQNNRKLSAREPNKSGNKELDKPINNVEDTVNEVEFDTVITDAELDTVINNADLDIPIKHEWKIPKTEKNEPSTFQVSISDDIIKEEYDLDIKGPPYRKQVKTVSERKRIRLTCETVLKHTSACPFRHHKSWFRCFYSTEDFIEIKQFKEHTLKNHSVEELKNIKRYPRSLQIDITDFKCQICDINLTNVKNMVGHFSEVHKMAAYKECIADYKVDKSPCSCHLCSKQYDIFRTPETHLNVHYANCICDICAKSFLNTKILKVHKRTPYFFAIYVEK